ncbi:hypothetical protein MPSEU_000362100 [Mayamaea pseudoterrestris]|nr:hypothetical protein MPSEU_000362100 [Mayamaea pseudoterrestris]
MTLRTLFICCIAANLFTQSTAIYSDAIISSKDCSAALDAVDSNGDGMLDLRSEYIAALETLAKMNGLTCLPIDTEATAQVAEQAYLELLSDSESATGYDVVACQNIEAVLMKTCRLSRTTDTATDDTDNSKTNGTKTNEENETSNGNSTATNNSSGAPTESTTKASSMSNRQRNLAIGLGTAACVMFLVLCLVVAWKPASSRRRHKHVDAKSPASDDDTEVVFDAQRYPPPEIQDDWCYDEENPQNAVRAKEDANEWSADELDDAIVFTPTWSSQQRMQAEPKVMGMEELTFGDRSFHIVIQETEQEEEG